MTSTTSPPEASAERANTPLSDWILLLTPGAVWGTSFYFIAEGLESFPAVTIGPLRLLFGVLALTAVPAVRRTRIDRADIGRVMVLGLIWLAVPMTMFPFAQERVSSSVTGMLNGGVPLFTAIVATIIARRLPPAMQLIGLLVGLSGVVLIALPTLGEGSSSLAGIGMILVALACYGCAVNLAAPLQQRYGSLAVMWRAQAVALTLTTPFAIPSVGHIDFAWWPFVCIVALGVFGTALAFVLMANNAGRMGSTRASVTAYVIPVVALFLGAVVRGEPVAGLAILGCGLALLGAYIAGRRSVTVSARADHAKMQA